ncbi:MAG: LacI family DNA-binding transcriptional regulator [Rubrivivax sp.]|nr:LacI family DNA-binding transcriptional regulator [Rubrivivax sp.]
MDRNPISTISDVAARAGVNVSTASRVLRADANQRVRPETRDRIMAAAKALNYEPNPTARALRGARTLSLGIVVPLMENPVYALAIQGAERAAWQRGYSLLIAHEHKVTASRSVYEGLARANRVDGLIVASLDPDEDLLRSLAPCGVPFVLFNRRSSRIPHCVAVDGRQAALMAVQQLAGLGHRRIAYLAGRTDDYNGSQRLAGFLQGLAGAGLKHESGLLVTGEYTPISGAAGMERLLEANAVPPTAVVATLVVAAGALRLLHQRGIAVPKDMSIVGLHDMPIAEMLSPPLTTVALPVEAMGHAAAMGVIDLIEGKRSSVGTTLAPLGLVERASTARPPKRR